MDKVKPTPLTHEEMRDMYRKGAPVSEVAMKARRCNGLKKSEVREILFGAPY